MPIPSPKADESRDDFIVRCHTALSDEVADTDKRNAMCFAAWRSETEIEKLAKDEFPTDKYEHVKDVPIFSEHEIIDRDGKPFQYKREDLEAIVEKCNNRILDTRSWAKLSDGHTPGPEDVRQGAKQPEVLGYAGNFKLGMIGNKEPRWAIFADEYRYKDTAQQTAKKPGRSVEVWLHENIADRFFDPIAALGAETPRLDLPMKLSKAANGVTVAKYSALAGNTNTSLPEALKAPKERYEAMLSPEEIQQLSQSMAPALAQALIQPVVQAIMQAQQAAAPPPMPVPPAAPAPVPQPAAAATPPVEDMAGEEDEEDAGSDFMEGDEEEDDTEQYMGEECVDDKDKDKMSKTNARIELAKYSRRIEELEKSNAEMKASHAKLQRERTHLERYSRLSDLQSQGYMYRDKRDENGKVLKSGLDAQMDLVADMTNDQFDKHCEVIVENYQKLDTPMGRLFGSQPDDIDPQEEKKELARKEATAEVEKYRMEGKNISWRDTFIKKCKAHGVTV